MQRSFWRMLLVSVCLIISSGAANRKPVAMKLNTCAFFATGKALYVGDDSLVPIVGEVLNRRIVRAGRRGVVTPVAQVLRHRGAHSRLSTDNENGCHRTSGIRG